VAYHLSLEAALLFDQCGTYTDAQLERMQAQYFAKAAALWGAQSQVAATFLNPQSRLLSKADSDGPAPPAAAAPSGAPPLPASPAPMRAGYGIPLSSSPFIDMSLVSVPASVMDARRALAVDATVPGAAPPSPPLWVHDSILFGSAWFSAALQCFPPECKAIQFYTSTDKVTRPTAHLTADAAADFVSWPAACVHFAHPCAWKCVFCLCCSCRRLAVFCLRTVSI
jgi:hypothetical protein